MGAIYKKEMEVLKVFIVILITYSVVLIINEYIKESTTAEEYAFMACILETLMMLWIIKEALGVKI